MWSEIEVHAGESRTKHIEACRRCPAPDFTRYLQICDLPPPRAGKMEHMISRLSSVVIQFSVFAACGAAQSGPAWSGFGKDAQHSAIAPAASQTLTRIHWQTPVDLAPQFQGNELLIHYGSPLITSSNTVIVPVKTGATDGFRVEAHDGITGGLKWMLNSNYILPPHNWTPSFSPALTSASRLYLPGAGGTVVFRNSVDTVTGGTRRLAFYGLAHYHVNPAAYNAN